MSPVLGKGLENEVAWEEEMALGNAGKLGRMTFRDLGSWEFPSKRSIIGIMASPKHGAIKGGIEISLREGPAR